MTFVPCAKRRPHANVDAKHARNDEMAVAETQRQHRHRPHHRRARPRDIDACSRLRVRGFQRTDLQSVRREAVGTQLRPPHLSLLQPSSRDPVCTVSVTRQKTASRPQRRIFCPMRFFSDL
ncbi:uncharacterized protein PV09_09242 [Verruconis gallopava]|uniref:Uncharacterized protein n=1 Tax=Verruconis gallopava TaxID=253628 RepID=A0A0D2AJD7_9PEZI|nr:uncharacterized protein PV09_09242 [Verruconis gallopava]KIV99013.1 hypothetical protein PV09_09242 [Verruconis gallopava]